MRSGHFIFILILFGLILTALLTRGFSSQSSNRFPEPPPLNTPYQSAQNSVTSNNPGSLFFDFYDDAKLACPSYRKIYNSRGEALVLQTAAPRRKQSVMEGYDLSLRNKWGRDDESYIFAVKMEQPDKSVTTATSTIVGNHSGFVNIPRNFTEFKPLVGVYRLMFQINDKTVECDAFRITQ